MPTEDSLATCRCRPVADADFGGEGERAPSDAVLDALATAAEINPLELPPFSERIDPNALDPLVRRAEDDDAELLVEFGVDDWNVFVREDGRVCVCDATKSTRATRVIGPTEA
jgi:hypothetical protein